MADFCWDCCERKLGVPGNQNDLAGLTDDPELVVGVLCEGCGYIYVDRAGKRVPQSPAAERQMQEGRQG